MKLTRADQATDARIFTVLGDGSNPTCHTKTLHRARGKRSQEIGRESACTDSMTTSLQGQYKEFAKFAEDDIPFGFVLLDGSSVRADHMSNELLLNINRPRWDTSLTPELARDSCKNRASMSQGARSWAATCDVFSIFETWTSRTRHCFPAGSGEKSIRPVWRRNRQIWLQEIRKQPSHQRKKLVHGCVMHDGSGIPLQNKSSFRCNTHHAK